MSKIKTNQTVISNTENEPFLLPIDISQYGHYETDELEVRITNDFVEVSGKQQWRMCSGGANKKSFQQRHVLPNYIDLNAILCRFYDDEKSIQTILISAPSISFVHKLTNNNQLKKVDYTLGLDYRGIQFLKRYNSTSSTSSTNSTNSTNSIERLSKDKENKLKIESKSKNSSANILFDLVKNPSKGGSNSRLFSSEIAQQNINFVNKLKNSESKASGKIYLNIEQLMKDKKKELELKKSKDKKEVSKSGSEKGDESNDQIAKKKSKKRKNRKRKELSLLNESKDESTYEKRPDKLTKSEVGTKDQESNKKDEKKEVSTATKGSISKKKNIKQPNLNEQPVKKVEFAIEKKEDMEPTCSEVKLTDSVEKKQNESSLEIRNLEIMNLKTSIKSIEFDDSISLSNKPSSMFGLLLNLLSGGTPKVNNDPLIQVMCEGQKLKNFNQLENNDKLIDKSVDKLDKNNNGDKDKKDSNSNPNQTL